MEPKFKIYGEKRRALKRDLGLLKNEVFNFWYNWQINDDMYSIYGGNNPFSKESAQKYYDELIDEIDRLDELLRITY